MLNSQQSLQYSHSAKCTCVISIISNLGWDHNYNLNKDNVEMLLFLLWECAHAPPPKPTESLPIDYYYSKAVSNLKKSTVWINSKQVSQWLSSKRLSIPQIRTFKSLLCTSACVVHIRMWLSLQKPSMFECKFWPIFWSMKSYNSITAKGNVIKVCTLITKSSSYMLV